MHAFKNNPVKNHQLSKYERLCNFSFKKHLFKHGNVLFTYPLKVFWITIDPCVENFFFKNSIQHFSSDSAPSDAPQYLKIQNPSFPFQKIPSNAWFHFPAKILFGAASKIHSSACKRNRIKRLMKEAYRQNKDDFYPFLNQQNVFLIAAFIYTGKQIVSYHELEPKIIVSLRKIRKQIANKPN
ncbi:MAG: ribonuclease P protein component [bacterium]